MDEELRNAFNAQLTREMSAGYQYLAMSGHFEDESLDGFARWMRLQAKEEVAHGMRLFDLLTRRGERPEPGAIPAPKTDFSDPLSVFEQALEQERKMTGHIQDLHDLAVRKGDTAARIELDWFVDEQVEEEDTVGAAVGRLRRAAGDPAAVLALDRELGARGGE